MEDPDARRVRLGADRPGDAQRRLWARSRSTSSRRWARSGVFDPDPRRRVRRRPLLAREGCAQRGPARRAATGPSPSGQGIHRLLGGRRHPGPHGIEHQRSSPSAGSICPAIPPRRRGLAHLHQRRLRRVRHRHGVERHRRPPWPYGEVWLKSPRGHRGRVHRLAPGEQRDGQGPDPRLHRARPARGGANYAALEFCGERRRRALARRAPRASANMAVEAGAKTGHGGRRRDDGSSGSPERRARGRPRRAGRRPGAALPTGGPASTSTACVRWSPSLSSPGNVHPDRRARGHGPRSTRSTSGTARTGR